MMRSQWLLISILCALAPLRPAKAAKWILGKSASPHHLVSAAKAASSTDGSSNFDAAVRTIRDLTQNEQLTKATSRIPLQIATGKGTRMRSLRAWAYESHLVQVGPTVVLNRIYTEPYWSFPQFLFRYAFGIMPTFQSGESHVLNFGGLRDLASRQKLYSDFPQLTVEDIMQALENYQGLDSKVRQ